MGRGKGLRESMLAGASALAIAISVNVCNGV